MYDGNSLSTEPTPTTFQSVGNLTLAERYQQNAARMPVTKAARAKAKANAVDHISHCASTTAQRAPASTSGTPSFWLVSSPVTSHVPFADLRPFALGPNHEPRQFCTGEQIPSLPSRGRTPLFQKPVALPCGSHAFGFLASFTIAVFLKAKGVFSCDRRDDQRARVLKADEPTIKQMVDARGQRLCAAMPFPRLEPIKVPSMIFPKPSAT